MTRRRLNKRSIERAKQHNEKRKKETKEVKIYNTSERGEDLSGDTVPAQQET